MSHTSYQAALLRDINMEPHIGIAPMLSAWKAGVLLLNEYGEFKVLYIRIELISTFCKVVLSSGLIQHLVLVKGNAPLLYDYRSYVLLLNYASSLVPYTGFEPAGFTLKG